MELWSCGAHFTHVFISQKKICINFLIFGDAGENAKAPTFVRAFIVVVVFIFTLAHVRVRCAAYHTLQEHVLMNFGQHIPFLL